MELSLPSNDIAMPDHQPLSPLALAVVGSVVAFIVLLRWAALPRPFPGIPYNKASAGRVLGDIPEFKGSKGFRFWLGDQFARHNSPIVQIFIKPFARPILLIGDFREAQDVMIRRFKEFDRSSVTSDCFRTLLPESHLSMKTADPRFKHQKELLKDLMTWEFLNEVSATEIHEKMTLLLDLWTIKIRQGNGRPFEASSDMYLVALDIILTAALNFPQNETMILKQIAKVESCDQPDSRPGLEDEPFSFPTAPLDPELKSFVYLTESLGVAFRSPLPRLSHWWYLQKTESKRAVQLNNRIIRRKINESIVRLEKGSVDDEAKSQLKCAVDQILWRERAAAEKRGVRPDFHRKAVYHELFSYVAGGHDTVSTTLAWWVKLMGRHQGVQSRLREALRTSLPTAVAEGRLPIAGEIARAHVPFLEAVIEETLRYTHIAPVVQREAVVDTTIFGHPVPKGTHIFFVSSTEGFLRPAHTVDEVRRSESSRHAKNLVGDWDPADMGEYIPERWLKRDGHADVFNPNAGPQMPFGAGPRGCFGRRLAYLELRIAVTLLTWNFEFLEVGEKLSSFEAVDGFTMFPKECYVRLKNTEY